MSWPNTDLADNATIRAETSSLRRLYANALARILARNDASLLAQCKEAVKDIEKLKNEWDVLRSGIFRSSSGGSKPQTRGSQIGKGARLTRGFLPPIQEGHTDDSATNRFRQTRSPGSVASRSQGALAVKRAWR